MQKKVPFSLFGKSKEKLAYLYLTYINYPFSAKVSVSNITSI